MASDLSGRAESKSPALPFAPTHEARLLHRRVNPMHVIVVIERIEKIRNFLSRGAVDLGEIFGDVTNLGGDNSPAGGL